MASVFTHAFFSFALGKIFSSKKQSLSFWLLAVYCSILPDGDVIAFYFDIPYGHPFGHRGFTHSIFFAAGLGILVVLLFFRHVPRFSSHWWRYTIFFFLVTLSHGVFDAMTNGGLGIAFFSPFSNERYFFPWRPLEVSPIGGLTQFFTTQEGWRVVRSELVWIWLPAMALVALSRVIKRYRKGKNRGKKSMEGKNG
jgi:inner membrane protein